MLVLCTEELYKGIGMLNMKKVKKIFILLFMIIFIILIFSFDGKQNSEIRANAGFLNLADWNFSQNGCVKLQGQWDLYYGELLRPKDVKAQRVNKFYNIPGKLSDQVHGKTQGYMTLHLKVNVPKDEVYGICFDSLFSSSDIWVNGVHLDGNGKVGKDDDSTKAIYRPEYVFFPSINRKVDIVIHTSTFKDIEPRLRPATFGTKKQIMNCIYKSVAVDGLIIGIMLIMGIISFGFYFTKPKQKRYLFFSTICFILILRCLVFNSRLLVQFYPDMNFEVLSKIAAITFYLSITFYILFLNDLFENKLIIKNMAIVFGTGFTALCMVTNNRIYDRIGIFAEVIVTFFILYLFVFLGREIYRKNLNAEKNIFPFIAICLTGVNDALVNNAVLYNSYFVIYGAIIFIISESIFIIRDYLEKHRKLDKINKDALTSLYNNKYIKQLLSKYLNDYKQKNKKFSLIMIDIDDFKGINDNFGHMFGDTVITDVAGILHDITEDNGYAGRYGGDEFIVILPKTFKKEAVIIAQEIMNKIDILNYIYSIDKKVSVSIGVYENDVNNLEECINNVDSLMYKSKMSGKDCINI